MVTNGGNEPVTRTAADAKLVNGDVETLWKGFAAKTTPRQHSGISIAISLTGGDAVINGTNIQLIRYHGIKGVTPHGFAAGATLFQQNNPGKSSGIPPVGKVSGW